MLYEYICDACEEMTEISHGMSESPEVVCLKCSEKMRKYISGGTGVIYKSSSGFRLTGRKEDSWKWTTKRANPADGPKSTQLTQDDRNQIEKEKAKEQEKKISDSAK